ncbi:F0F1 ATP synthase subunit delta [Streptococcus dentiloxodontae]
MDKKTQGLVKQYAKSLVEVSFEQDAASVIQEEASQILAVFEETNLNTFLKQENVLTEDKKRVVSLFQESCSVYMNNFLEVILLNERTDLLYDILKQTLELFSQENNEYDVVVTSSLALSEGQKERLLKLVAQKFEFKPRRLVEKIDENLIGGFVVTAKNKVIDTSIRRQLQAFKSNLK